MRLNYGAPAGDYIVFDLEEVGQASGALTIELAGEEVTLVEYTPPEGGSMVINLDAFTPPPSHRLVIDLADYAGNDSGTGPGEDLPSNAEEEVPVFRLGTQLLWGDAPANERHLTMRFKDAGRLPARVRSTFADAGRMENEVQAGWSKVYETGCITKAMWSRLSRNDDSLDAPWSTPDRAYDRIQAPHGDLERKIDDDVNAPFEYPPRKDTGHIPSGWDDSMREDSQDFVAPWGKGNPNDESHHTLWGKKYYDEICTRDYEVPSGLNLNFELDTDIEDVDDRLLIRVRFDSLTYDLRCRHREPSGFRDRYDYEKIDIAERMQIKNVYQIMNNAMLKRVSDDTPVDVTSMSMSADMDSWCWSFSATIRTEEALDVVMNTTNPVVVEAEINGYVWRFIIESWRETRSFGRRSYTVSGRSQSALLTEPYTAKASHTEATAMNAVQLAEAELADTGWSLTWGVEDWLVPVGVFSYQNLTPVGVIQRISQAAGGVLQSDRSELTLQALPRYCYTGPWNWGSATPDVYLYDSIIREFGSEWAGKTPYNAAFVSGTSSSGVVCKVYRTGTAGDQAAPMVTEALITDTAPAREKGRTIIAGSGKWSNVSVQLPLTESGVLPGLLAVGQLAEVGENNTTWRGQVVSVKIDANRSRGLNITQSATIERYYGN